ncbi:MAG: amidase [Paracoccaceae bacterium]
MSLCDRSASDLSRMIARRETAPSEIMAAHIAQIAARNPAVNAIVSPVDPDILMAEARAADDAPRKGWLHGLPHAVKDLCATRGLRTTWGSPLFADFVPEKDDLLAARLRAAGAIFVGKTNAPEWGQGSHSFNPVFGVTRNPYDLSRSAGGSSGGAAAAVAARMVPVADGSDMMGSLRNPAAFCNIYGFRPSWGLVPGDAGGESFMATMVTDGPMARTIEDLVNLLAILSGPNPEMPFGRPAYHTPFAAEGADMRGKKIGWLGDWGGAYPMEPGILDLCAAALQTFVDAGAHVEEVAPPFPATDIWRSFTCQRSVSTAYSRLFDRPFHELCADPNFRGRIKPETRWEAETGLTYTVQALHEASAIRSAWYAAAARLFQSYDALVLPSAQVWPFSAEWRWPEVINDHPMDTYHRWMEVVLPVSLIGLPALSLPVGFGANGLPMGMQIFGPDGSDAEILAMGQTYHQITDWPARPPSATHQPSAVKAI